MNWVNKLPQHSAVGAGIFLLVALIVTLSKKLYEQNRTNPLVLKKGASCVKKAAEHALVAQDVKNPLLALTKANYALAYLNIARDLALDDELTKATQIPIERLREDLEREEQRARDRILKLCPQVGQVIRQRGVNVGTAISASGTGFNNSMVRPPVASGGVGQS